MCSFNISVFVIVWPVWYIILPLELHSRKDPYVKQNGCYKNIYVLYAELLFHFCPLHGYKCFTPAPFFNKGRIEPDIIKMGVIKYDQLKVRADLLAR